MDYVLLTKYQELWAKYSNGAKAPGSLPLPKLTSQEEAIRCSLALKTALEAVAQEQNAEASDVVKQFLKNANKGLLAALNGLKGVNPQEIIDRFELFFDFDNLDDLFLSDGKEISCVISID